MAPLRALTLVALLAVPAVAAAEENPPVNANGGPRGQPQALPPGQPGSYVSAQSFDVLPTAVGAEGPLRHAGKPLTSPRTQAVIRQGVLGLVSPVLGMAAGLTASAAAALWLVPLRGSEATGLRGAASIMLLAGVAPGLALLAVVAGALALTSAWGLPLSPG